MISLQSGQAVRLFPTERQKLYDRFADKLEIAIHLNRQVVSNQTNKTAPIYRWVKYKEGFSSELVKYFLKTYSTKPGRVLDPFAGSGTTLFAGKDLGWVPYGIELLPVGSFIMRAREALGKIEGGQLRSWVNAFWKSFQKFDEIEDHFKHISITKDAFPEETEVALNKYLTFCETISNEDVKTAMRLAAFAVLEEISYTRKDGQYLRWDYRSKRNLSGKPFDKGIIRPFEAAITTKLAEMVEDLLPTTAPSLFELSEPIGGEEHPINIIEGSCLEQLPKLEGEFFDFIVTSPPYCNRYDYTRTYALELVFLGHDSDEVRNLRQTMLSCTVENREKIEYLRSFYVALDQEDVFNKIMRVYDDSLAMSEINIILAGLNKQQKLNNNNIPRMVRNYFLELCFVIYEMARVTKSGGYCVMVNDNVQYGGEEVPVDLILSEFAENFGFEIEKIFVLPRGKGNSSQQMGKYGRTEIRKCVCLWRKI